MLLLKGHSLEPARKVPLESMSLQLTERDSSAAIQPADMTGIGMNSWLQDDTEPGKGIVWRVKSIRQAYATRTPTVQLEHAITTLKDRILFGEVKPSDITGNKKDKECTAAQAIRYILSKQSAWTLGTCEFTDSNPYTFDGDTLYDALESVSDSLEDCWWDYDFSSYPFKISLKKKSSLLGTVLRPGRNLTAVTKTVDRTGMYTRFYPIGKDDLHIDGNYVERNTGTYGVISKTETDSSIDDKAALKKWANGKLKRHAEPVVTVDVDALELSRETGEPLDRIVLGRKCMMPLAEFDTEILETVTAISYGDKIHQPDVARVTLANKKTDATRILGDSAKRSGRAGRAAGRKNKNDNAWMEDTNDHVALCARGIIGVDAEGNPNWERLSRLQVDDGGISSEVKGVQTGLEYANSRITQTENEINQVVTAVGKDGKVTAASICLAINNGSSSAQINADRIILSGTTTINDVMTVTGRTVYFNVPVRANQNIMLDDVTFRNGSSSIDINTNKVGTAIQKAEVSGNTLKLTTFGGAIINFNRAITEWVRGGSNGKVKVTARPQDQVCEVPVGVSGNPSISQNGTYSYKVYYTGDDGEDHEISGTTLSVSVNVGSSYTGRTLRCTSAEPTYPGSTTKIYTFTLEGNYSFSSGSNYTMYRTSW